MPIIAIMPVSKIDPRFPSVCVTRYEVTEDGDTIRSFSDPEKAESFAYAYADSIGGHVEE
jgi:hypothetical protein